MTQCKPRREGRIGIPMCDEDNCPSYDGKRCRLTGFRPSHHCEPALESDYERFREFPKTIADGTPGVRDADSRCEMFTPGKPTNGGCEGDGHYLCRTCTLFTEKPCDE